MPPFRGRGAEAAEGMLNWHAVAGESASRISPARAMNAMQQGQQREPRVAPAAVAAVAIEAAGPVGRAVAAAQAYLLSLQREDGHWCAVLEGDSILESEYLLTRLFLGRTAGERVEKAAAALRAKQLPGGGWSIYPGGPPEVSASVKAYFVLKVLGDDPDSPHMRIARQTILDLGGIEGCNSFTRIYLAIFGQVSWADCPAVPPEIALLPRWFYFNLYAMSAWSRTIVVPLAILWAAKPARPVPAAADLGELATGRRPRPPSRDFRRGLWAAFFTGIDRAIKVAEALRLTPLRRRALARSEAWMRERLADSDGLGAIFPPIVNSIVALTCLGYPEDDPILAAQVSELERLVVDEGDTLRLQPCFSSVWDTALAATALAASDLPAGHPALAAATRWLVDREVRRAGDWTIQVPGVEPSGWVFEYANAFYPDCDDTAQVLTALAAAAPADARLAARRDDAVRRGLAWLLAMQNRDGGWGAFDRGCDKEVLTLIPFADHNAMIDPSTADVTGRTLEALANLGLDGAHPAVRAAEAYLLAQQEPDGSWYGRWGVNYLYGTWLALSGLARHRPIGGQPWCRRAVGWIAGCQNLDGGWGESPRSYDEPEYKGRGPSTAAQTAWALLALLATGVENGPALRRGVNYLLRTQREEGGWVDEPWTGTGFPKVFYLRYRLYATYFPLLALARYEARR